MTREIRKDLNRAGQLYKAGKRPEAFEIYEKHFLQNPEKFNHWDKIRYCWCIYYLFIRNENDAGVLVENTENITDIVKQEDLNKKPVCVYTLAVFKVIMTLKSDDDWEYMLYWLDKLNPELLNQNPKESSDFKYPSKKEDYYRYLSTAYLKCGDYEDCINTSKEALDVIDSFAFNGDVWHKWRIAKSLNKLDQPDEALKYLNEVVTVEDDWYVLKEIADCCHQIGNDDEAIRYASKAALTDDPVNVKVNLYRLIYDILKDSNPDLALEHAKLFLALKLESGAGIPDDIEDLDIDEDSLDITELESEIRAYWSNSNV